MTFVEFLIFWSLTLVWLYLMHIKHFWNTGLFDDAGESWDYYALEYFTKKFFFNKSERELMILLESIVDSKKFVIFAKPRLIDIFDFKKNDYTARQKIISKHVDYLICSQNYFNPIMWIELDWSSHESQRRIKRDEFFDYVFEEAGLPLMRIATYELRDKRSLENRILDNLDEVMI